MKQRNSRGLKQWERADQHLLFLYKETPPAIKLTSFIFIYVKPE